MRDDERQSLANVRNEYGYLDALLLTQTNPDPSTVRNLEATYLLRLYATFEAVLRNRLIVPEGEEPTLVNLVQRLSGESVGYDPANDGRAIAWWRLFRRDRNLLAHGHSLVPALSLDATRTLMTVYLAALKE